MCTGPLPESKSASYQDDLLAWSSAQESQIFMRIAQDFLVLLTYTPVQSFPTPYQFIHCEPIVWGQINTHQAAILVKALKWKKIIYSLSFQPN